MDNPFISGDIDLNVLKSSPKYLIVALDNDSDGLVLKISHKDNEKLIQEVNRIMELKTTYPKMNQLLPELHGHGDIKVGFHSGKYYYLQTNFPGRTFSNLIQSHSSNVNELDAGFRTLFHLLVDAALEHSYSKAYDCSSGIFIEEAIRFEYKRIFQLDNIKQIASMENLSIDGKQRCSLSLSLNTIFESDAFHLLNDVPSFISDLGHWNFHGDNIILNSLKNPEKFKLIDPDVSIDKHDPLMAVARFLYTMPHDTADYGQYIIKSKFLEPSIPGRESKESKEEFFINHTWPLITQKKYMRLFNLFYNENANIISELDLRFKDKSLLLRLKLCYLFCLIRGVNANYDDLIVYKEGNPHIFKNKSIYLLLNCIIFSHNLSVEIDGFQG